MTEKTSKGPITFEEFQHMLADVLQMDEEQLYRGASFVTDLMVEFDQAGGADVRAGGERDQHPHGSCLGRPDGG